ncbi:MAG: hypothetical protein DYH08_15395, partial [Actinobacteria bacterium ATB1]|nr:hypothetical protein [Actinobacteria bacterium ATB1]
MVAAYRTAPFAASIALAHETSASRPGSVLAATLPVGVVRETEVSGHVDDVWRVEAGRENRPLSAHRDIPRRPCQGDSSGSGGDGQGPP